jgi:hypothetical protein
MAYFTYNGVPLNTILAQGSTSLSHKFSGLNVSPTNYNGMRPLATGFMIDGVDISNLSSASTSIYTSKTSISVPTGVKQVRIIALGGGGGGGGAGGDAEVDWSQSGVGSAYTIGGNGTSGGYGKYLYATDTITSNKKIINIFVGNGGSGGAYGAKGFNKASSDGGSSTKGKDGDYGGVGGSSVVQFAENTSNVVSESLPQYIALGGRGGLPGNGGTADMSRNRDRKVTAGTTHSDIYGSRNQSYIDINYDYINTIYHGVSGNGGSTSRVSSTHNNANFAPSNSGTSGYVELIWLYG